MAGYSGPRDVTPGDGARTNVEDQREALKRSLEHARGQATRFHEDGQQWARDLTTCEILLADALAMLGPEVDEPCEFSGETMRERVERCLPGFAERARRRENDDES